MPADATNPTLLLTGATGFLGRRLAPDLASYGKVAAPGRAELDLAAPDSIRRAFDRIGPAVVVHCGAIAAPDACEAEPALARRVNADATRTLADLCARSGARLILISTDLVFDGEKGRYDEDDAANPLSVYGRTKLDAEEAALSRAPGAVAVRVAAVYGRPLGGRPCFVDELLRELPAGRAVAAFTDQWRSPTAGDRLGEVLLAILAEPDLDGVFHWGGAERATRFETAVALCRALGFDERLVRPARMGDKRTPAQRPRDSSLDSSRLAAALGLAPVKMAEGFAALKAAAAGGRMGLDVVLEDEFGEELDSLMDETGRLGAAFPTGDAGYPVLRFVDKEGTTLLNRLQATAALPEFEAFARTAPADLKSAASFLLKCARRTAAEPHLYLRFFGD